VEHLVDDPELIGPPTDELPARDVFLKTLGVADGKAPGLLRILLAKCKPDAPLPDQVTALEQLGRFIVAGPSMNTAYEHPALGRLELLVLALERIPAAQRRFEATVKAMLVQTTAIKFFGE
jgi:hypothetical protein